MLESSEMGVRIRFYPSPASTWGCVYENRLPPLFFLKISHILMVKNVKGLYSGQFTTLISNYQVLPGGNSSNVIIDPSRETEAQQSYVHIYQCCTKGSLLYMLFCPLILIILDSQHNRAATFHFNSHLHSSPLNRSQCNQFLKDTYGCGFFCFKNNIAMNILV